MQFPDIFVIFQHELLLEILDRLDFFICGMLKAKKLWKEMGKKYILLLHMRKTMS